MDFKVEIKKRVGLWGVGGECSWTLKSKQRRREMAEGLGVGEKLTLNYIILRLKVWAVVYS